MVRELYEQATVGSNRDKHPVFLVSVNAREGNERYFKLYNNVGYTSSNEVIRLSFDAPIYFDHVNKDGKKLWRKGVPFKDLCEWFDEENKSLKGFTNWKACIYLWNLESGFDMNADDFLSGKSDVKFGKRKKYVLSTKSMPDYTKVKF